MGEEFINGKLLMTEDKGHMKRRCFGPYLALTSQNEVFKYLQSWIGIRER